MVDLSLILAGFGDVFTPINLLFVIFGVVLGQFVGAVPGIGPVMAMAIAIPFTPNAALPFRSVPCPVIDPS